MYVRIRGPGLTYSASLSASVTTGKATLRLYRSSRVVDAYAEFRKLATQFSDPNGNAWKNVLLGMFLRLSFVIRKIEHS